MFPTYIQPAFAEHVEYNLGKTSTTLSPFLSRVTKAAKKSGCWSIKNNAEVLPSN